MPVLGYGGYLPFALELYALYHIVMRLLGDRVPYLQVHPEGERTKSRDWAK
jgi:hypothetical protein